MRSIDSIKALDPKRVLVIDTETTGLKPYGTDEILSLTIIDLDGTVLFDELVRPQNRKRWPKAQEIHGITWAMVKEKQPLRAYQEQIAEIWDSAELVVGYNVGFDTDFIHASGLLLERKQEFDVMREFAPIWGKWDDYHGDYRWAKLTQCAKHYRIQAIDSHSSLGDAETTRQCYLALMEDDEYLTHKRKREAAEREWAETREREQKRLEKEQRKREDNVNKGCNLASAAMVAIVIFLIMSLLSCVNSIFG